MMHRGKTMISYRVSHWLQYFHDIPTKVLNLGNTRRKMVGEKAHSFFDANNQKAQGILDNARKLCLAELRKFLQEDEEGKHVGRVAIYDAANITEGNRKQVIEVMKGVLPRSHIIFVEIIQTNKMKIDVRLIRLIAEAIPDSLLVCALSVTYEASRSRLVCRTTNPRKIQRRFVETDAWI
eukprot:1390805-Amorphochlora_amoeboformis.AAC.1